MLVLRGGQAILPAPASAVPPSPRAANTPGAVAVLGTAGAPPAREGFYRRGRGAAGAGRREFRRRPAGGAARREAARTLAGGRTPDRAGPDPARRGAPGARSRGSPARRRPGVQPSDRARGLDQRDADLPAQPAGRDRGRDARTISTYGAARPRRKSRRHRAGLPRPPNPPRHHRPLPTSLRF